MKLNSVINRYISGDGSDTIWYNDFALEIYYANNTHPIHEVIKKGFAGTVNKHTLTFVDHDEKEYKILKHDKQMIILDDNLYHNFSFMTLDGTDIDFDFKKFPSFRAPHYLFKVDNEDIVVYVSMDKHKFDYNTCHMYVGNIGGTFVHVPIKEFTRYRDGGTTYIKTDMGVLFAPTPFEKDKKASFNKKNLESLNPEDFTIIEDHGKDVTINLVSRK
jgi:hypothetical protein